MSLPHNTNESWKPCPPGYLQRYASQERQMVRKSIVTKAVAVSLLLTVIGWAANYSYRSLIDVNAHSVNAFGCYEVIPLLPDYVNGKLDADEAEKIRRHLDHCPMCRERLKTAGDPQVVAVPGAAAGPSCGPGCCKTLSPSSIVNR
ncbi:MAG: zf-HC2 domain-containing protein [Planctomycetaceae bacterium]